MQFLTRIMVVMSLKKEQLDNKITNAQLADALLQVKLKTKQNAKLPNIRVIQVGKSMHKIYA